MRKSIILAALISISGLSYAQQRSVSITIDDVPNVHLAKSDGSSGLLQKLDSLKFPSQHSAGSLSKFISVTTAS